MQNTVFARKTALLPALFLLASLFSLLFANITLSSNGFWFLKAIQLRGSQVYLAPLQIIVSPKEDILFVITFCVLLLLYFLGVSYLPGRVSYKYIFFSTFVLGIFYLFIPIITSQDIFSYIAYARMETLYHLNPLTTTPTAISGDSIYHSLYWANQPSIYGPTWIFITGVLLRLTLVLNLTNILFMQFFLRLWGLVMHLGSLCLVMQLSRQVCLSLNAKTDISPEQQQKLRRATFAFAWNPFLLLEACVNAHNDTTMLFLILLALCFLTPSVTQRIPKAYLLTTALLAVAACLKITALVLFPGFLLFLLLRSQTPVQNAVFSWMSRLTGILASIGVCSGIIVLFYTPFWQNGELLHILLITPGASRDINSIYESVVRVYAYAKDIDISPDNVDTGSWVEIVSHQISTVLFVVLYIAFCLRSLFLPRSVNTLPALIRWLALAWLLYCFIGSPWFWPWYIITFLGLAAVIEPVNIQKIAGFFTFRPFQGKSLNLTAFSRVISVSTLSIYFFTILAPDAILVPFLPHLRWMYLRGLLTWLPPFIALYIATYLLPHFLKRTDTKHASSTHADLEEQIGSRGA
jgi:hypothetical protein